jgi:phage repressor protein C with HTH and peptisase S24 domain
LGSTAAISKTVVAKQREVAPATVLPFQRVERRKAKPYVNSVPLVDLKFAAGRFSGTQIESPDHDEWAILPSTFRPRKGLFVAQVIGESMNRRIANGAWCLFRYKPTGTRNDKVVVAEHRDINDPETGGSYTVKLYRSKKEQRADGSWRHLEICLRPDSDDPRFKELVFGSEDADTVQIVAELIAEL